jgi:hypothetical protein
MRDGQNMSNEFRGAMFMWSSVTDEVLQGEGLHNSRRCEVQRLTFHKHHRRLVIDEYLPHDHRRGREVLFGNRRRRLYSNNMISQYWYYDEDNAWIALIRRGWMDKHIEAFRIVAKNYLGINAHPLFGAVEELLMEVDIAECLMTAKNAGSDEDAT